MKSRADAAPLLGLLLAAGCVGVRADAPPPSERDSSQSPASGHQRELISVEPNELAATSGEIAPLGPGRFAIHSPTLRAELGRSPRSAAEVQFVYLGPTASDAPLASGELRRQIGLKLRARDTCNVVYVMWHVEPSSRIVVSVKSNPGQSRHEECGDRGYSVLASTSSESVPEVTVGQAHALGAEIRGHELWVTADGKTRWVGRLPNEAFEFDGPIGVRSDNGEFSVALRAEKVGPK
ncbi:MAG TPA: hypothetical protein VNN80_28900 [Polyangiaceae bacterium]|nr:hypothetical protein [Polyangiaceae bacterium]